MGKAKNRKRTKEDYTRPFMTGEHFRHGLPIRRSVDGHRRLWST